MINALPKRAAALTRKEFFTYLNAPAFYGAAVFFLLFTAIMLFNFSNYFAMDVASLRPYFSVFPIAFVIIIPVLTMKSWAEERKTGSIELLLTMPFSEWDLVLGKFFSILAVFSIMLGLTIPLVLCLLPLGVYDGGMIVCEYIGAFLLGASAISLGLLMSMLSKNQAGAFLSTLAILMVIMLINQLTAVFNLPQWLTNFINFLSLSFHFESFSKGFIDTRDLLYFILSIILFLYLNTRIILHRKWS
ncbi:MAG: ABC transporter permease [Treponema sp.]|nr:ABC transporter permease [Treponema sp.]